MASSWSAATLGDVVDLLTGHPFKSEHYTDDPNSPRVLGGDNIYTDGEIEKIVEVFEQPYRPLLDRQVQFHACLGNSTSAIKTATVRWSTLSST